METIIKALNKGNYKNLSIVFDNKEGYFIKWDGERSSIYLTKNGGNNIIFYKTLKGVEKRFNKF